MQFIPNCAAKIKTIFQSCKRENQLHHVVFNILPKFTKDSKRLPKIYWLNFNSCAKDLTFSV